MKPDPHATLTGRVVRVACRAYRVSCVSWFVFQDGKINFREFVTGLSVVQKGTMEERLKCTAPTRPSQV